jgi:hypothetical protein
MLELDAWLHNTVNDHLMSSLVSSHQSLSSEIRGVRETYTERERPHEGIRVGDESGSEGIEDGS